MKASKKSLVIKDLNSNNAEHNFGVSTSFGILASRAQFFADFSSVDEDGIVTEEGAQAHTAEFMEYEENKGVSEEEVVFAKSYLEALEVDTTDLDEEIIALYAAQLQSIEEAPNAFSFNNDDTSVRVTVQRKSINGRWFNVTDKYKNKFEYFFDIADLFILNDKDEPISFKMAKSVSYEGKERVEITEEAVIVLMKARKFLTVHNYSYIDQETGEMVFKSQEQRFLVQSQILKAGVTIDTQRLESTVAPFFSVVNDDNQIEFGISYYGYDNVLEFGNSIVIIPSSKDESHGAAASKVYNDGILIGTSVATQSMMSDDMAIDDLAAQSLEEAKVNYVGRKARVTKVTKHNVKLMNARKLLKTELGIVICDLVPRTWAALKDANLQNFIFAELKAFESNASELMEVIEAHRDVHGKGFAYPSWQKVDAMITAKKNEEFAAEVDAATLVNITRINKGLLTVDRLDDETVVKVRKASLKFGKKNPACWIVNPDVSNALRIRCSQITNMKSA